MDFTLQQGKEASCKKGEYLVRQREACKIMGFVVSGSFHYCCVNSLGEGSIVGYTFDHSLVGNYPAFQLQDQSNVDIQALYDCTVYMINHSQLTDFYDINDDHQKLGRRITETLLWEAYGRMTSMCSLTPEERYLDIINRCPDPLKLITLKELASYLLIRPEALNRIRRKVVRKQIFDSNQDFIQTPPLSLQTSIVYFNS